MRPRSTWPASRVDFLQLFLDHGANIEVSDLDHQQHGLFVATEHGHTDVVQLLIDRGARIDRESNDYRSQTPLACACDLGHLRIAELLLQGGADPNGTPPYDGSFHKAQPLFEAVSRSYNDGNNDIDLRFSIIRLLVKYGAQLSKHAVVDSSGRRRSPLDDARSWMADHPDFPDIERLLLETDNLGDA